MSEARKLIARASCNRDPDDCVHGSGSVGSTGSHFECNMRAWEQMLPTADRIIKALHAAGYRIIGPGELDKETVELVATAMGEADKWDRCDNSPDSRAHLPAWLDYADMAAAAIRALSDTPKP